MKCMAWSMPGKMKVTTDHNSVVTPCETIIRIFRDEREHTDRQKVQLAWLMAKYDMEGFRDTVIPKVDSYNRGAPFKCAQPSSTEPFARRELLGVHLQAQEGKPRVAY